MPKPTRLIPVSGFRCRCAEGVAMVATDRGTATPEPPASVESSGLGRSAGAYRRQSLHHHRSYCEIHRRWGREVGDGKVGGAWGGGGGGEGQCGRVYWGVYVNSRPHRGHGCSTRATGIVGPSAIEAGCGPAAAVGGMYGSTTIGLDGCGSSTGGAVDQMTGGISRRGMSGTILGAA